jgi:hypothetical protein
MGTHMKALDNFFCENKNYSIKHDSVRKVNILCGNSIGHCEEKRSHEHLSNSEWLPTQSF